MEGLAQLLWYGEQAQDKSSNALPGCSLTLERIKTDNIFRPLELEGI